MMDTFFSPSRTSDIDKLKNENSELKKVCRKQYLISETRQLALQRRDGLPADKKHIEDLTQQCHGLRRDLVTETETLQHVRRQLLAKTEELAACGEQCKTAQDLFSRQQEKLRTLLSSLQGFLDGDSQADAAIRTKLEPAELNFLYTVRRKCEELHDSSDASENRSSQLSTLLAESRNEVSRLAEKVRGLETLTKMVVEEKSGLQTDLIRAESLRRDELAAVNAEHRSREHEQKMELSELQAEISRLTGRVRDLQAKVEAEQQHRDEIQSEYQATAADLRLRLEKASRSMEEYHEAYANGKHVMDVMARDFESEKKQIHAAAAARLGEEERRTAALEQENKRINQRVEELEKKLRSSETTSNITPTRQKRQRGAKRENELETSPTQVGDQKTPEDIKDEVEFGPDEVVIDSSAERQAGESSEEEPEKPGVINRFWSAMFSRSAAKQYSESEPTSQPEKSDGEKKDTPQVPARVETSPQIEKVAEPVLPRRRKQEPKEEPISFFKPKESKAPPSKKSKRTEAVTLRNRPEPTEPRRKLRKKKTVQDSPRDV